MEGFPMTDTVIRLAASNDGVAPETADERNSRLAGDLESDIADLERMARIVVGRTDDHFAWLPSHRGMPADCYYIAEEEAEASQPPRRSLAS
jgi:hypothetical protein